MLTLPVDSLLPSSSWLGLIGLAGTWGRPISDRLYRFLVRLLDILIWGGELQGWENLPERGPAVFIGNHLDALGPIAAVSSIPLRLYPWIIADMVDETKAAAYLNQDFTERQLHIPPPFSMAFCRLLSRLTVPLLRSLGCIPVYHDPQRLFLAFETSLRHLEQGHCLLIFPEDPAQSPDPLTRISPFYKGFTCLGEMFYERSRKSLKFYPFAVSGVRRIVRIGEPIAFNPLNSPHLERLRLKDVLENAVRTMYIELHRPLLTPSYLH
jgi:hypothetical protein